MRETSPSRSSPRTLTAEVPVRVDYALTPLGRSQLVTIEEVKRWAEVNMPAVEAAQLAYDEAR